MRLEVGGFDVGFGRVVDIGVVRVDGADAQRARVQREQQHDAQHVAAAHEYCFGPSLGWVGSMSVVTGVWSQECGVVWSQGQPVMAIIAAVW